MIELKTAQQPAARYCLDACALIDFDKVRFPHDHFEVVWKELNSLVESGAMISPREVRREVVTEVKEKDWVNKWASTRKQMFINPDEEQEKIVTLVLTKFPKMLNKYQSGPFADPWVVALAKARNLTVITSELPGGKGAWKIPDICRELGVACFDITDLIRAENWKFNAKI
ncbi:MAG: DUF4411 family protein [Patescibacteria group bacterium]|nr:MAG: DUF4411 family protein [Patescibacteria group bacterium]